MVIVEENKSGKLSPQEVGESIAFISFNKFFNCLNQAEKDAI